jgi:hypothetical protein
MAKENVLVSVVRNTLLPCPLDSAQYGQGILLAQETPSGYEQSLLVSGRVFVR